MTYKRVLLKLSGEALMGEKPYGIDPAIVQSIAEDVSKVVAKNIELAIVVGGGNIFRGLKGSADGMDRATADYVGMLATVMNAISLQDGLERVGVATRVQTAIEMQEIKQLRWTDPVPLRCEKKKKQCTEVTGQWAKMLLSKTRA